MWYRKHGRNHFNLPLNMHRYYVLIIGFPSLTWLTKISAIADIGIVSVSDNAAANDDVKKQPLTLANITSTNISCTLTTVQHTKLVTVTSCTYTLYAQIANPTTGLQAFCSSGPASWRSLSAVVQDQSLTVDQFRLFL